MKPFLLFSFLCELITIFIPSVLFPVPERIVQPAYSIFSPTEIQVSIQPDPDMDTSGDESSSFKTCSGSKTVTFCSRSGSPLVSFTLNGSFIYNDTAVTCIDASCNVRVYDKRWTVQEACASINRNQACGEFTMTLRINGLLIQRITEHLTLTCTTDGSLS